MPRKRIRCFVAMAFGRKDCDQVYDRHILPVLKGLDVEVIRVDRRQHKDDLNNYIIRMLKESDIVLADLTYARPSVYYEAGFAERSIPIVYTVRKDHLSRSQRDDRLRVHFDLEMKKIVTWSNPDDNTFSRRLRQRLSYLLRPMLRKREDRSKLEADSKEFQSLSVFDRCAHIRKTFSSRLRLKRFWIKPLEEIHRPATQELAPGVGLVGVKMIGNTCHFCFVLASETITKKQITEALYQVTGTTLVDRGGKTKKFHEHYFFCALKSLPESRLTSAFPRAEPTPEQGRFKLKRSKHFQYPPGLVFIHMFPSIESKTKLDEYVRKSIGTLSDGKTNRYTRAVWDRYGPCATILFRRKK